jgi:hypothetical protein
VGQRIAHEVRTLSEGRYEVELDAVAPWWTGLSADRVIVSRADADPTAPRVSPDDPASAPPYLLWQMDRDRKATTLKAIQGQIWDVGYATGVLKGPVWPDVVDMLDALKAAHIPAYIYSSGSVAGEHGVVDHASTPGYFISDDWWGRRDVQSA